MTGRFGGGADEAEDKDWYDQLKAQRSKMVGTPDTAGRKLAKIENNLKPNSMAASWEKQSQNTSKHISGNQSKDYSENLSNTRKKQSMSSMKALKHKFIHRGSQQNASQLSQLPKAISS